MRTSALWLAALVAGCASTGEDLGTHVANVRFVDTRGQPAGDATLYSVANGVRIVANLPGVSDREYGFHIHSVGECNAPMFESAGPHYDPAGRQHGRLNPAGPHLGDLPNVRRPIINVIAEGITPDQLLDRDGAALILHANQDDLRTDPSGNSGARIRCGVIHPG